MCGLFLEVESNIGRKTTYLLKEFDNDKDASEFWQHNRELCEAVAGVFMDEDAVDGFDFFVEELDEVEDFETNFKI